MEDFNTERRNTEKREGRRYKLRKEGKKEQETTGRGQEEKRAEDKDRKKFH